MPKLIFDIETVGDDFDALDSTTQENLTRWIKKEFGAGDEYEDAFKDLKDGLGFSPLTGHIVAIGILDYDKEEGAVYFDAPGKKIQEISSGSIKFKEMSEKEMLQEFWKVAEHYDEFISFNGRAFDAPFLIVRSAVHKVKPTRDLMEGRYLYQQRGTKHIDLLDQLTFYGAVRRKGSLHLWTRAFDIKSPKEDGISGDDVSRLFKEKKYLDIAKYNVGDLNATRDLYDYWKNYILASGE
ncbi:MAG: ribonuclease H-like domain-containing protein [bacterium]|nr:ribonuclease H-like domain-containing protein [bacterium]